jgi:hypothetical protein
VISDLRQALCQTQLRACGPASGCPDADPAGSAFLALRHSLPQRATGEAVNETSVLAAHKEAWKSAGVPKGSPMHVLMAEPDPLHRALAAGLPFTNWCKSLDAPGGVIERGLA